MERIEEQLRREFGSEVDQIDRAESRYQSQEATLLRSDGTTKYTPEEHAERVKALLAEYDATAESIGETAALAIARAEQDLARLAGADPLDALTPDELARASGLKPFVDEDAASLPPEQLAARIRGVLARGDKAASVAWLRGLDRRLRADSERRGGVAAPPATLELHAVRQELADLFADPKAKDTRQKLEQRISSAKVLAGQAERRRRELDGTEDQALAEMRRQYATF